MQLKCILCGVIFYYLQLINGSRILGVFYFVGKSHFIMYEALMKGLADRGHEVTVLSHFPQKKPYPNYIDIDVSGSLPAVLDNITVDLARTWDTPTLILWIGAETRHMCDVVLRHPKTQTLLKSNNKYDVVINEIFGSECSVWFAHRFKAPLISMISSVPIQWTNARVGNPDNPAYIPNYFLPYNDKMTFTDRLINTLTWKIVHWVNYFYSDIPTESLARKYFGEDIPSLWEMLKSTSIIFANSHFTLNGPRPTVPALIEVGGLHVQERPEKLPSDVQKFIDESEHGVIYFSFGSLIRVQTLPSEILQAILDAFSELPQRVLMKYTGDSLKGQPKNVKVGKWLPQMSILQHPNVVLFISHGGLMGVLESVHSGTPLLGIPFFADQESNILKCVTKGTAIKLEYDSLTKDNFLKAIRSILDNSSYAENARVLSERFRDRPQTPLETAVFWTEYVIRHKGAHHLRSAAVDLEWYQYLLLDVIAVILLVVSTVFALLHYIVKKLIKLICRESTVHEKKKHKRE